jgi:hypothetical protein
MVRSVITVELNVQAHERVVDARSEAFVPSRIDKLLICSVFRRYVFPAARCRESPWIQVDLPDFGRSLEKRSSLIASHLGFVSITSSADDNFCRITDAIKNMVTTSVSNGENRLPSWSSVESAFEHFERSYDKMLGGFGGASLVVDRW